MLGSTHPNRRSFVYKKPWRGRLYGRGRLGARKKALLLTTAATRLGLLVDDAERYNGDRADV